MHAAIVSSYAQPPYYGEFDTPIAQRGKLAVRVHAGALTNLVKAQAGGRHYSSSTELPLIPGNDGVGTRPDSRRVYFIGPRAPFGSMAERPVIPPIGQIIESVGRMFEAVIPAGLRIDVKPTL